MDRRQVRAFEAFAAESGGELPRIATLLTSDEHLAEDVYQETLQRLAARWSRVRPGRYVVMREIQDNYVKITVIDSLTGDVWTYQHGAGVPAQLPVARHDSPTQAQFAAVPTSPAALRALLIAQYDQQQEAGRAAMAAQAAQAAKAAKGALREKLRESFVKSSASTRSR